jgi:lysophospholipase L1-like esterase
MRAKHGYSRRNRGRVLIGCLIAALALTALIGPAGAGAAKAKTPIKSTYLALGDSLAFGYSTQLTNEGIEAGFENPESFEAGYVNDIYAAAKGEKSGVRLQNDGCPGETTTSMIGSKIAAELNAVTSIKESQTKNESLPITGVETPAAKLPNCLYQEVWNALKTVGVGGPLHHSYSGESQLEDALATIKAKQNIEKQPVTTVTLNIGPNDELHAVKGVEKEIEAKVTKFAEGEVKKKFVEPFAEKEVLAKYIEPAVKQEVQEKYINPAVFQKCKAKAEETTLGEEPATAEQTQTCLETEGTKLGGEYFVEHEAELIQKGKELVVPYFLAHKKELTEKGEAIGLAYAAAHAKELGEKGAEIGHKYAAEHAAQLAEEAEGKIVELANGEGIYAGKGLFEQINSNVSGILYALRNGSKFGGVDYTGAIDFLSAYNPYGKLFNTAAEATTFVEAHGGLAGPFAAENTGGAIHPAFNTLGKVLNAQIATTVKAYAGCATSALSYFNPGGTKEPARLQALTNMANGTENAGKFNGPDIHPTPAGYKAIAKLMKKECSISGLARKAARHGKKK